MPSLNDKFTDTRNATRPNSATVSSGRVAGGATLACDDLTGWPTASKAHFVTYQVDTNSNPVASTQLDCEGIVLGSSINSFTVIDGTDTGNVIGDIVEMLPTAGWGQDLADGLTAEHNRDGTHSDITADSVDTDTLVVNIGTTLPAGDIGTADINDSAVTPDKWTNPYSFRAYASGGTSLSNATDTTIAFATEVYDYNNNFASNTYTAPVDGVYHFDAMVVHVSALGANALAWTAIYKNGSVAIKNANIGSTANLVSWPVSGDILLAAGDTITVVHRQQGTSTETSDTGNDKTWFSGHLVHQVL